MMELMEIMGHKTIKNYIQDYKKHMRIIVTNSKLGNNAAKVSSVA